MFKRCPYIFNYSVLNLFSFFSLKSFLMLSIMLFSDHFCVFGWLSFFPLPYIICLGVFFLKIQNYLQYFYRLRNMINQPVILLFPLNSFVFIASVFHPYVLTKTFPLLAYQNELWLNMLKVLIFSSFKYDLKALLLKKDSTLWFF